MDKIPLGTFQRTGDNILPLILKLVNSKQISDVEKYSTGNLVIPFLCSLKFIFFFCKIDCFYYILLFFFFVIGVF